MIVTSDEMLRTHGILLRRCQQVALAIFTQEAAEYEFSPTQYSALAFIHIEPGIHQNTLGERIALDRSSVTKCVEGIENRGLIRREVDRRDKRARLLYITPLGEEMLENVTAASARARGRIKDVIGEDGYIKFIGALQAFSSLLDEEATP